MTKSSTRSASAAALALMCLAAMNLPATAQIAFSQLDKAIQARMEGRDANYILDDQREVRGNIDTRIAQLRAQVSISMSRKWISPDDAAMLNRQLDIVQSMETRYSRVGLTVAETQDILGRLRTVSRNINGAVANAGNFRADMRRSTAQLANLENQRLYLQSRIDQGVRLGRLNEHEVRELRRDMQAIQRLEAQRGGLTPEEQVHLRRQMAELNVRINRFM